MKTTDNQNEIFDIVDKNDNVIGQARREEVRRNKNLIHRSIGVAIFNKKGEMFLQQRSAGKDTDPLKWTISCSGHVLAGENYEETVLRELNEELGLDLFHSFLCLPKEMSGKERAASVNFLVSLTSDTREETSRMQSSGTPHLCRSARETNENLQRQINAHSLRETTPESKGKYCLIEPVCKYLCRVPNETEMVMLYKTVYGGPFKLNPTEILKGKFFTQKELLEAIEPTLSADSPGKMETRRKRGEHPVPSRRNVGIGAGIELSFMGRVALEKMGWIHR